MGRLRSIGNRVRAGGSGFSPTSLFSAGEDGALYDPSDFASLFQGIDGSAVTATGQTIGILLDKRLGMARGSEIVSVAADRTGSSDTGYWSKDPGVTISSGFVWTAATGVSLYRASVLSTGSVYEVTWTISSLSAGGLRVYAGGNVGPTRSAPGTYTDTIVCGTTNTTLGIQSVGSTTGLVTPQSWKSITGNHSFQSTSGSRPLEQQSGGLYAIKGDGLDDYVAAVASGGGTAGFFFCAAINPAAVGANQTLWADTGSNTGYRVRLNASNQLELSAGNGVAFTTAATVATVSIGTAYVVTAWHDGTNLNAQINSGTVAQAAFVTATAGTAAFTLGASNGGASGFFNGYTFAAVYRKSSAPSASAITQTQQWAAAKAGISI